MDETGNWTKKVDGKVEPLGPVTTSSLFSGHNPGSCRWLVSDGYLNWTFYMVDGGPYQIFNLSKSLNFESDTMMIL